MRLFRRKQPSAEAPASEHAVITYLPLSGGAFGTEDEREAVFALEDRIAKAVARIGGEHDGNEFGEGQAILYTYGPDADALLSAIRQSFGDFPLRPGAHAVKRFGRADEPDARTERVQLAD